MSVWKPWRHYELPPEAIEESKRALERAKEWEARSRRTAVATERAIVQNHFARDMQAEFGRRP